jgi:hypothetical protein
MQDHLDDAMACFDEAVAVCSAVGNTVDGWFSHFGRALTHLALGNTVAALHDACLAVRVCGGNRPHEAAASLRLVALVVDRAGHEGIAARYDRHADLAYQALVGPMEPQIEAMLARAT